ncbi:uncharacterized protein KQ657_000669 [Scheffersomyces spartinae]|uniref:Uncharacterized protein n=1 Tax=Scheffersomyces spartinae TaxID=45513 RepID=A0A9P7VA21_9ASCO|nr:uncharacterized protein KQ657_000669 [Scheffersomyces spartinae]KAG7193598.1 hypothetical protein KQ657_000669 [Scheffersomyces spartinae]
MYPLTKVELKASKIQQDNQKQQILSQNYKAKAQQIWEWALEDKDTSSLFNETTTNVPSYPHPVTNYNELRLEVGSLTYSNKQLESIMLFVATYWINTVIVELNIRKLFQDKQVVQKLPASSLIWRENLLYNIKDPIRKPEIMNLLQELVGKEFENEKAISKLLDGNQLGGFGLGEEYGTSECFNSLQVLRTFYHNYRALSDHFGYPESDVIAELKSETFIKFESPHIDSSEYELLIANAFEKYHSTVKRNPLNSRLELILSLSSGLLRGSKFTPSLSIFKLILDKLGQAGLFNYQSIVFDALCSPDWSRSLLGTPVEDTNVITIKPGRIAAQYRNLVQSHPEFLTSLMTYAADRKDELLFLEFLAFLRLEDTIEHEKVLRRSIYSNIISRSRFPTPANISLHPVVYQSVNPIMVDIEVIYEAIRLAIDLNKFEYIDLLINKLLAHLVMEKPSGHLKLILFYGDVNIVDNDKFQVVLGIPEMRSRDFGGYIFTKQLIKLVLKAARKSDDVGRLMWLIPHIDNYLASVFNGCVEHLNDMDEFLRCFNKSQIGTKEYTKFMTQDINSPIDICFINELSQTLRVLGIEGKWNTYNELLDFDRVDVEQVVKTNKEVECLKQTMK